MYIAIGGIDGCGKSTLRRHLVEHLEAAGLDVVGFSEPYHDFVKRLLEETRDPWTDVLLFALDRWLLKPRVEGWIEEGKILVASRSIYCSVAYQGAQGIRWEETLRANNWTQLRLPDVFLLLDLDAETAYSRCSGSEKFERRDMLERAREQYLRIYDRRREFPSRMFMIDSGGAQEETLRQALSVLMPLIDGQSDT